MIEMILRSLGGWRLAIVLLGKRRRGGGFWIMGRLEYLRLWGLVSLCHGGLCEFELFPILPSHLH